MRFVGGVVGGVIGSAFGFPQLGYAIGSLIGGSFEKQSTVKNVGPRLDDLSGPTSNIIGSQIPILYGTDRISAKIIWTSNKKEKKHVKKESSGGKGGGGQTVKTTTYTYSISFAAAICEGEILGIRRIWINKAIVYDLDQSTIADPDLNFKLYLGTENQLPDSTMEGYLGAGNVPAYRGLAYIVFKNLQLEKYGNHVPVNIEVEAVGAGVLTSTITQLYSSDAIYYASGDDCNSANFIVQSPITGIIWTGPNTSTGVASGPVAYGFDTGGHLIRTIVPDINNVGSHWSDGHLGINGAFLDVIGNLVFISYDFWETGTQLYMGIRLWDEEGTVLLANNNIKTVDSGSFLDMRNYRAKILVDGVHFFTNLTTSAVSQIFMVCPRSYLVINLDGSYSVEYQISTTQIGEADIADKIIVSNSNYQNQGNEIINYLRGSEYGMRIYEDDDYNLKTTPIGTLKGTGNNVGRSEILVYKQDPNIPYIEYDTVTLTFNIAEFQGIPASLGTLNTDSCYCISELILNGGDSYAFLKVKTSTSGVSEWLFSFYKQSVDIDYSFISTEGSDVGNDITSFSPVFDRNSGDMIFFTTQGTDRIITFNIYDRSWSNNTLSGWPSIGEFYFESKMTFIPRNSPHIYLAREVNSKHNFYKLSIYSPNKNSVSLGSIVTDLSTRTGIDISDLNTSNIDSLLIKGFTIRNHSNAKSNISAILPTYLVDPVESEWKLKFEPFKTTSISINQNDLGAIKIGDTVEDKYKLEKKEIDELPKALALHYSGFANNYLKTQQSSMRNSFIYNHDNSEIVEIPVVMEDNFAAQLVEKMLYILWISATTFEISLPIKYSYLEPTDIINFYVYNNTENFIGKITSIDRESNSVLEIKGEKYLVESITSYATGALEDNNNVQSIPVISFMYVQPIDFRPLYEVYNITKQYNSIYIVGSGYSNNWVAGEVFYSTDGRNFEELTYISNPVIFGKINADIPGVSNNKIMQYNTNIDITVLGNNLVESITLEEMKQGKNTMLILNSTGVVTEVLQFMTATQQTSKNRYILSNLWRHRYNTYDYSTSLQGSRFIVVDDVTLKQINISGDYIGSNLHIKGVSVGQYEYEVSAKSYIYNGIWSKCVKPIHVKATEVASGNIKLDWKAVRRFKPSLMFKDATLYQTEEKFKVEVYNISNTLITSFSDITAKTYTYVLDNGFVQGDYMKFRIYQYSDIYQYNTEYAEILICTNYDGLINTLVGTKFLYVKFNELHNATTLIDYSTNADNLIGTSLPAILPFKGPEFINKLNGSFRQGYGKYVGSYYNPVSDIMSYSFWILLDKKPSGDHIIFRFNGSALYGEHTMIINSSGQLVGKHVGNTDYWVSKTLTIGKLYHVVWVVNYDNAKLYINNVLSSNKTYNSGRWQVHGVFEVGDTTDHGIVFYLNELITFKSAIGTADIDLLYKAGSSQLGDKYK